MIEQHGMKEFKKHCQSCGVPLDTRNCGTEFGYVESKRFCKNCMKNGEFLESNLTVEEVIRRRKEDVEGNTELNGFKKKIILMKIPSQIKKLERWKDKQSTSNINADKLNTYNMNSISEIDDERDFAKKSNDDFQKGKKEHLNKEEPKVELKEVATKKEEPKVEKIVEPKKEETKVKVKEVAPKKVEPKKEEVKEVAPKKEEPKVEIKKTTPKKVEPKVIEEPKVEKIVEPKKEETKVEVKEVTTKKEEPKKEEVKEVTTKKEEPKVEVKETVKIETK